MKAFILAAGLGTRLKPWTETHPKALVPVGGIPMLQRVIGRLRDEGFDDITINVHHFADQIDAFLEAHDFGVKLHISDESQRLLDTGGGLLNASATLSHTSEPFLVHNVDILSDAPLASLMQRHIAAGCDISLVTSRRASSRKLLFDAEGRLKGWHNLQDGVYRPDGFRPDANMGEHAFSGIYIVNPVSMGPLGKYADLTGDARFPVMDFLLHNAGLPEGHPDKLDIREIELDGLELIDIGKPDTLRRAERLLSGRGQWA